MGTALATIVVSHKCRTESWLFAISVTTDFDEVILAGPLGNRVGNVQFCKVLFKRLDLYNLREISDGALFALMGCMPISILQMWSVCRICLRLSSQFEYASRSMSGLPVALCKEGRDGIEWMRRSLHAIRLSLIFISL